MIRHQKVQTATGMTAILVDSISFVTEEDSGAVIVCASHVDLPPSFVGGMCVSHRGGSPNSRRRSSPLVVLHSAMPRAA